MLTVSLESLQKALDLQLEYVQVSRIFYWQESLTDRPPASTHVLGRYPV